MFCFLLRNPKSSTSKSEYIFISWMREGYKLLRLFGKVIFPHKFTGISAVFSTFLFQWNDCWLSFSVPFDIQAYSSNSMIPDVDIFISNYTLVDPEVYQLWVDGCSCKLRDIYFHYLFKLVSSEARPYVVGLDYCLIDSV